MSSLFMDEQSYESYLFCSPGARTAEKEQHVVTENDLEHLLQLLERKDGEMEWQTLMEKSTPNMTYQAWRCEPEVGCHLLNISAVHLLEKCLLEFLLDNISSEKISVVVYPLLWRNLLMQGAT